MGVRLEDNMSPTTTRSNPNRVRILRIGAVIAGVVTAIMGWRAVGVFEQARQDLDALLTHQPPQVFHGDAFTLVYPSGWQVVDIDQPDICKQPGVECLITIGSPSGDGGINLMRFSLDQEATLEELDQALWAQFESSTPDVAQESREAVEVGGQPAIRRIFNYPYPQATSGRVHVVQIYIVKGLALYQFTLSAPSAEALTQHQAAIEAITASLQFEP
jgi:hypothetical protein